MAFEEALAGVAAQVEQYRAELKTEEATKTAVVMPFISRVLGYDVFNPSEVIPEYIADVGMKKGEKVDFAIMRDGEIQILIEAKAIGAPLTLENANQLVRYFHVSSARVAVLTNGQHWHFFTDLDKPNRMDDKPFLRLDLMDIDPYTLPELKKLTKVAFDLDSVLLAAEELKYVSSLKRALREQFESPSDDFVRLLTSRVYGGPFTAKVRDLFSRLTATALQQFVNDQVNGRLKSALRGSAPIVPAAPEVAQANTAEELDDVATSDSDIETTLDELEGFHIIRAIVASEVPYDRVVSRDTKSYFGVLIDDNNRKPVCRLHFNRKQKYVGLFDEEKVERREAIERVEDLYHHAEALRATVGRYL
ncbi:type I restriction enzyme HsdR N-terminal domain-containing protein [Tessaracoccus antarcticus]|uniref:Restriction endonuclease n=1 Tax=Tessaracoccus antarcticus TaxID=2479848 RepID=A0A3M0GB65_9ACTN|nr:type I restriction enzyme HsdR N-terminal domain-containing protein [Tessaracoccus antarcticus]RMB62170.1 restriction endonuclease [Tessaracoccus antarcticus]